MHEELDSVCFTFHRCTLIWFRVTLSFSDDSTNNSTIFFLCDVLTMKVKQLDLPHKHNYSTKGETLKKT